MTLAPPVIPTPPARDPYRFGPGPEPVLQPGTLGWTVDDLCDPIVGALWDAGRYEILNGVLTVMPAALFRGGSAALNLQFVLKTYFAAKGVRARAASEVDIAVDVDRVVRADGVVIAEPDLAKFEAQRFPPPAVSWRDNPLTLPPTIVIESLSLGHEAHDRVTKLRWYAELGVPNYWLVDSTRKTLECLRLSGGVYQVEASGAGTDTVSLPSFEGLAIALPDVWEE